MRRVPLLVVVLVVLLVLGGGGVVAVKLSERQAFLRSIEDEVRRQLEVVRPDLAGDARAAAARILAAQAALESGYGSSVAYLGGWNAWNVSAGSTWRGETVAGGDLEYTGQGDGAPRRIVQAWRKYPSLADAVSDLWSVLGLARYRAARDALFTGDPDGYATELRAGGYFTAPLAEYQAGIASALDAAGGLPA